MNDVEDCPLTTTNRDSYKPIWNLKRKPPIKGNQPESDVLLIGGHFRNNLQVHGRLKESKIWPNASVSLEEYKEFLKRFECCKKEIYKMYFRCPVVNVHLIERMLRDLGKSTYQISYSPDVHVLKQRCPPPTPDSLKMAYHETTYRTYFSRLEEFRPYKDIMLSLMKKDDKIKLNNELRKLRRTGTTTYYATLCIPAKEHLRKHPSIDEVPIDRYTLRRV